MTGLQVQSIPIAIVLTLTGLVVGIISLHRIFPVGTLKAKAGMPAAIATMGFLSMAYFGGEAFLPLTLISIRGQNTLIAGVALTAATLTWTAGSWLQAKLAPRQGRRMLVSAGLLLIALGLAGIGMCTHSCHSSGGSIRGMGSRRAWYGSGLLHNQSRCPGNSPY